MDEYDFDDDFDDQTLAALDQIEKSLLSKKHVSPPSNPPAKRLKTETGWRAATTAANNSFDLDELPEISLCQNTYTFQQTDGSKSPSLTPQPQYHKETDKRMTNRALVASGSRNISRNNSMQSNRHSVPPKPPAPAIRSTISNRPSVHRNKPPSPPSSSRRRNSARLLEHITNALATSLPEPLQPSLPQQHVPPTLAVAQPTPAFQPATVSHPALKINEQIVAFQKQLEGMRLENEKIRALLKEAEEARISKFGEVAVLRRGIQKTAEDHAAQISKLKAAKEDADAKQMSTQRELKEEMERLKTQFIFKQHELESNTKRPPMSVHARRNIREMSSSTQTPVWGTRATGLSNRILPPESTPVRAPSSIPRLPQFRSPEKTRQSAMLPGFENSFLESTPKRQSEKGKAAIRSEIHRPLFADELRARDVHLNIRAPTVLDDDLGMDIDVPPKLSQIFVPKDGPRSSPSRQDDDDVEIDEEDGDDTDEEFIDGIHLHWKAELARVVLTHTHPSQSLSTFQILAEQSTTVSVSDEYSSQMSRILEVIASPSVEEDYDREISVVTQCLISMACALNNSKLVRRPPSHNLRNGYLTFWETDLAISAFAKLTINLNILTAITQFNGAIRQLAVENHSDATLPVAAEVFSLAESLCWRTPEDSLNKLNVVVRNLDILTILLDHLQPCWFLVRATRLLALMFIHPQLARSFLSLPTPEVGERNHSVDIPKIPQLDRLCFFLVDTSRIDEESMALKENVATVLAVLSQAHPDTLNTLASSNAVIPSLILYLTHLSSAIWEETESLISSPPSLSSTIKSLNQTIHLLHYLVFSVDPEVGLKLKLQHASSRPFNGVTHMFIITFGRLSYAPIPDWIKSDREYELSAIRDMARDLLDLVVDGPECDNIYAAYHDEEEDEGEMEEELLGDT
ncbi:hypothetical protein EV368DRAFT_85937 [Lentinula lateritia]|nr:hypothetical protein EV368DRAFT_85937 [Lentinula lateritia]